MSETVDIDAELIHETEDAYLIDDDGKRYWLPKSKTEWDGKSTFTIPSWLGVEKGLC